MKIFTTAAALVELGEDFTYETELQTTGSITAEGVLEGNVIIKGSGDPTISDRYHKGNKFAVFDTWIDALKKRGIRKINGDVIGDDRIFDNRTLGPGWSWDYLEDWYAAQVSGLAFNDNCVDISVSPGARVGARVSIRSVPDTRFLTIVNNAVTVSAGKHSGLRFDRRLGSNEVTIEGQMAMDSSSRLEWITVSQPTLFAVTVFQERLQRKGIDVTGEPFTIREYNARSKQSPVKTVAVHRSPTLKDLVRVVNKRSHNFFAEQLLKTLGAEVKGEGSFSKSTGVIEELLADIGLNSSMHQIFDGSGLSRLNLVSAVTTVRLLRAMVEQNCFATFYDSLPEADVSGTLSHRMGGTPAAMNLRAKTGSIGNARALSGYLTTQDGETWVFSIIINNFTPYRSYRPVKNIDKACVRMTDFTRY